MKMVRFVEPEASASGSRTRRGRSPPAPPPAPPNTPQRGLQRTEGFQGSEESRSNAQVSTPQLVPSFQAYKIPHHITTMVRELLQSAKGSQPSKLLEFLEKDLPDSAHESLAFTSAEEIEVQLTFASLTLEGSLPNSTTKAIQSTPLEIFFAVLDNLDEASATTLGLTCKALWAIHKIRYPHKNSLLEKSVRFPSSESIFLYQMLKQWMGEDLYYFAFAIGNHQVSGKFLTKKQCMDKVIANNKGVEPKDKRGCFGIWEEGQEVTYAPYQTVVFKLCHEKVKIPTKPDGFQYKTTMFTPWRPCPNSRPPWWDPRDDKDGKCV
ncbi:uncharacterized protein LY89DRAFT_774718 [Mollisia scopiformis]|uniref:Uncharacterized protein n=1 Tax=Mollisia scopiformis TaxID=149040 RepID=A0A194XEU4_MOLSC|nr:uncharacterized protein LY89DRAFT_774718 [Mollisia scopiformis]KUJ18688.1 hypothetical protein LY89DRAFT_774718 [Mollisia scopiformis]